jgi:hypothetical protein
MPSKRTQISGTEKLDTQTLCITTQRKQQKKELNTIINIALNNGYRKDIIHIHNKPENNA